MEDKLINFQTAVLAKEKGFDYINVDHYYDLKLNNKLTLSFVSIQNEKCLLAPTQSLLQAWLRKEKGINIIPPLYYSNGEKYAATPFPNNKTKFFKSYEECLEHILIEKLNQYKMLNKSTIEVSFDLFQNKEITDEYLFRQLALKMVNEIPASELKKLIKFTKTDPNSREFMNKMTDINTPEYEKNYLMMLARREVIIYQAEILL